MYTYEFIIQNIENKLARLIIFEKEVDTDLRCVYSIHEGDIENINHTCSLFQDAVNLLDSEEVKCLNESVDYGKAKLWCAKMKKIIQTLVAENRER